MPNVYLGIGSNLGDRHRNIKMAMDLLTGEDVQVRRCSTLIETAPVGGPPQGPYINGVIHIKTSLSPHELLTVCLRIERILGRRRTIVNGPRTIDIDILLYDDLRLHSPELIIPHPRMWEREFVTIPLKEIAPHLFQETQNENI